MVSPELERNTSGLQIGFFRYPGFAIGERDAGAALGEQVRRGHTTPGGAHDQHLLPAHGKVLGRHRSFNVVRLNSANRIATIRNRVMTFGSAHPLNSKW